MPPRDPRSLIAYSRLLFHIRDAVGGGGGGGSSGGVSSIITIITTRRLNEGTNASRAYSGGSIRANEAVLYYFANSFLCA